MSIDLDELARDAVADAPTRTPAVGSLRDRARRRRRKRRILIGVIAAQLVAVAAFGAWATVDGNGGDTTQVVAAEGPEVATGGTLGLSTQAPGDFVWPAPPRDFEDVDELTTAFIAEVLRWSPEQVRQDGGTDKAGPQSFTLVNLETNQDLHLLAVPSNQGWGFVQIGDGGLSLGEAESGGFAIRFRPPSGTVESSVGVRYLDGTITSETTTASEVMLPVERSPQTVVSALIIHIDESGAVASVSGGQFATSAEVTTPSTVADGSPVVPDVIGLRIEDATDQLAVAGLDPQIIEALDSDVAPGVVLATDPAAGTQLATGSTIILTIAAGPSQTAADATRDQIVPELAALPPTLRIRQVDELFGPTQADTAQGTWIISQPDPDNIEGIANGCLLGDPNGAYGIERICITEYAEILLIAHGTGQILRAYPFPGMAPRSLQVTNDAVYCIRQGDGGLPDSMLCRIDLDGLEATVRVFPSAVDSAFSSDLDPWTPSTWTIDEPTELVLWENLDATDSSVTTSGFSGTASVDPVTLALDNVQEAD